jgi:hypothetical protein
MARRFSVADALQSRPIIGVTLSPFASAALFEYLTLMSMNVVPLCKISSDVSCFTLGEKVARTKFVPDDGLQ